MAGYIERIANGKQHRLEQQKVFDEVVRAMIRERALLCEYYK